MEILRVKNLSVRIGEQKLLTDISFTVGAGQIVAVVGPNGAGKTTLMRALLGLLKFSGQVAWSKEARLGYVPQKMLVGRSLTLTVEELFLLKSPRSFWWRKKQANEWLKKLGAANLQTKLLTALSGGELQRVLIAYALAGGANVLCLDEPAAGLDVGGGQKMHELLHQLVHQEKLTIILISHELDVVYRFADEVLCLDKRLICSGTPEQTLTATTLQQMYGAHAGIYAHHRHG